MKNRHENGMTSAAAFILAISMTFLIIALSQILSSNSRQSMYLDNMNRSYRLAESGMNKALGLLVIDPHNLTDIHLLHPDVPLGESGQIENVIYNRDFPVQSGFYIVTTASCTSGASKFVSRLHTYARISNVGDYFAAISDRLVVSDGVNAATGKIYAPYLEFKTDNPSKTTTVLSAEYVKDTAGGGCIPAINTWDTATKAAIDIIDGGVPVELKSALVFPQVLDSDLSHYKTDLGGGIHIKCDFRGDTNGDHEIHIFPPGYTGVQDPLDDYDPSMHTANDSDHVYYCPSPDEMYIQGTVHGQVLFVAEGNIHISSGLVSAVSATFPGSGPNASKAHQAVLLTRSSVFIDNTFFPSAAPVPATVATENIEALIMAPNPTSQLVATAYANTAFHDHLALNFTGSLILGSLPLSGANCLPNVFKASRTYSYMDTLKTFPPPYLPAVAEIYYSVEETLGKM